MKLFMNTSNDVYALAMYACINTIQLRVLQVVNQMLPTLPCIGMHDHKPDYLNV